MDEFRIRSEVFELTEGHSLIDVRGGPFDSMLMVDGKPVALNWCDCAGSIAQYLVRAGVADYQETLKSLRYTLDGNLRVDVPMGYQLHPFLDLFVPGRYRLDYLLMLRDLDSYDFDEDYIKSQKHDFFYPYPDGLTLIYTQASESLNPERVIHYLELITEGHRPIALTATVDNGRCNFVIDGHHKLQAYKAAGLPPNFVSVCRLDAPRLPPDAFDVNIGPRHPMAEHYRTVKKKHDNGAPWGPS